MTLRVSILHLFYQFPFQYKEFDFLNSNGIFFIFKGVDKSAPKSKRSFVYFLKFYYVFLLNSSLTDLKVH